MREGFPVSSGRDDTRYIMDRILALENLISAEVFDQALIHSGLDRQKACVLSHRVMLWVVLAMGLFSHLSIRQVFKHARRMCFGEKTPARSSLCEGRQRLGVEPVRYLHQQVVRPMATANTRGAFYHGMRLMGIDATINDAPDSPANAARFGRSNGGRGEGAFPQVRKLSLIELGTHIETAFAFGGWQDSERTLARLVWGRIPLDALLLADRGFFCVEDWKTLNDLKIGMLYRINCQLVLREIERLADGSYLAKIFVNSYNRSKDRNGTLVRVLEYTLNDPQRVGHGEQHRILTNLLDAAKHPALELIVLYHERWEVEMVFDEQKTHQDPRRPGKPAQYRSETPLGVEQEIYALSLGHFVVRAMMLDAAEQTALDVDRLSFTGCFRILQARLPECNSSSPESLANWYRSLMHEIANERIEPRRNRINPRVVKRKMSKFTKKQPWHRGQSSRRKPFINTVLIL